MTSNIQFEKGNFETFGIEIIHSRSEVPDIPPDITAKESLFKYNSENNIESISALTNAVSEIEKLVIIERNTDENQESLIDIFTADQILEMQNRVHKYLGKDLDLHLQEVSAPPGYPLYIGRLATHFILSDNILVSNLGAFINRHSDPLPNATGPYERNSRELANWANEALIKQFESFYQSDLNIKLVGPQKRVAGGRISWERGVAESQFLVLDYVRDLLSSNGKTGIAKAEIHSMTVDDIGDNIRNLLKDQKDIATRLSLVNPIIAEQFNHTVDSLKPFTMEVMHRGRLGQPRYYREPDNARRAILRVESILTQAASLVETREDQAEIPVLDI